MTTRLKLACHRHIKPDRLRSLEAAGSVNRFKLAPLCELTVHHVALFEEDSLLAPLTVDQPPQLLGGLIRLCGTSEDSHHHQDEMLQGHRQQHLDAFVATGRGSGEYTRRQPGVMILSFGQSIK